ncbi:hypothetical protein FRC18_007092 [Serendipita sp. 400]|nr:hypothetical protein FRC18_007092 [Serendipita sp. 400]
MQIVDSSAEIRLHIELAVDGLLLNNRGGLPANKLLELAQTMRKAWEEIDPLWTWTLPCDNTRRTTYEISDGILAYMVEKDNSEGFQRIIYHELVPSQVKKERWEQEWKDIGFVATDFSYNLHDDVQIFMELRDNGNVRRMHFLTISTNQPHPRAYKPYFDVCKDVCPVWEECKTIAYDNYIAMLFLEWRGLNRSGGAMVIDWRTASVVLPYTRVTDLAFASKDTVILMYNEEGGIRPALGLYSLAESRLLCRCVLPFLTRVMIALFLTNAASKFGENCPATHAKRFIADPGVRILGMIFHRTSFDGSIIERDLVVLSVQPFLRICARHSSQHLGETTIEWDDWGPTVTRWLPSTNFNYIGFRSTFGSRMLVVMTDLEHSGVANSLGMLDFNPRPILKGYKDKVSQHWVTKVLTEPSEYRLGQSEKVIENRLPVRVTALRGTIPFRGLFMDGTTIVGSMLDSYRIFSFLPSIEDVDHPHQRHLGGYYESIVPDLEPESEATSEAFPSPSGDYEEGSWSE